MKIYRNKWASYKSYFVEMASNNRFSYGLKIACLNSGPILRYGRFEKADLKDTEYFPVVGTINLVKCVLDNVKEEN